jgi:hypothetical protein
MVLRKIFRPKGEEVIGGWRKLHNEELRVFYSPDTFTVNKTRGLWQVSVTTEGRTGIWWENQSDRDHLKNTSVDGRTILKYVLKK